jgi:hypothetical protein
MQYKPPIGIVQGYIMVFMKLRLFYLGLMAAAVASAETFSGTVVDVMCKGKDLAGHTRSCALDCAKSGFGLVQADGKFLKFDESGNARTLSLLKKSAKDKDLKMKVTGTLDGEVIKVQAVELLP